MLALLARQEPWCDPVRWLSAFRGISTLTALGLLGTPRELMSYLGASRSRGA